VSEIGKIQPAYRTATYREWLYQMSY